MKPGKWLLAVAAVGLAVPAAAHHGWGSYDAAQVLTIDGTVDDIRFENPHGMLILAVPGRKLEVTLAPPSRMVNRGLTKEQIKVGDTVQVVAYPERTNPNALRAERITVAGKTTELR